MIIDNNFLDEESKLFIDEQILGKEFPFYIQVNATRDEIEPITFLHHLIVFRPEDDSENTSRIISDFYPQFLKIFQLFTDKNNIQHSQIYRCSLNLTFKNNAIACPIHIDHEFDHKQLLIYINNCEDKDSKTVLLDKKGKNIIQEVSPEQYKGICFDSCPHFHYYPKNGIRIVLVYTFT